MRPQATETALAAYSMPGAPAAFGWRLDAVARRPGPYVAPAGLMPETVRG
ncbi:hypothetical protein PDM23_29025 [Bacillus cereus group sp. Bcc09]|nr:hypothetical protein [Bacillus cereus group sp. Bcc09]MDA2014004.1 hypothetical protein [Bacillus cereus group sp. Bcc09]